MVRACREGDDAHAHGARRGPWCRAAGVTRGRMGTRCPLPACARPACRSELGLLTGPGFPGHLLRRKPTGLSARWGARRDPDRGTPIASEPTPAFGAGYRRLSVARRALATDDDQERTGRLLLLREGAVLAHRLERPLAAGLDDQEQCGASCATALSHRGVAVGTTRTDASCRWESPITFPSRAPGRRRIAALAPGSRSPVGGFHTAEPFPTATRQRSSPGASLAPPLAAELDDMEQRRSWRRLTRRHCSFAGASGSKTHRRAPAWDDQRQ
jgi:hypothetical protein